MPKNLDRPFLLGENIYLRPLDLEDINNRYLNWLNDVTLAKFIPSMSFPATRSSVEQYVSKVNNDSNSIFLAIIEKDSGEHVGNLKLGPIDWIDRRACYGRLIGDKMARSKGYGSEAIQLILKYAFEILNLNKVTATCLASNKAAIRSNEKNGLAKEGLLKEDRYAEGHYQDVVAMGITRKKYFDSNDKKGL